MPRSGEAVRQRLQEAAVELFLEHGYDQVTTGAIAARAGVTERTYFRHFADKREVLFDGEKVLIATLTEALAAVPAKTAPLPALLASFRGAVPLLERNRPVSEPRSRVIATAPALQERALAKGAFLVSSLAEALRARGVDRRTAELSAQVGMDTFTVATRWWAEDTSRDLRSLLDEAFADLSAAAAALD